VTLFLKALFNLFVYDIVNTIRPFKAIPSAVKAWKVADKPGDKGTVRRVCAAVNYACVWYPNRVLCLQRSFVTTYLLRKQGVPAQMVLGAQRLPFKAHAWVEVNGRAINERSYVQAIYGVWERS
jgi:hypothetical protein